MLTETAHEGPPEGDQAEAARSLEPTLRTFTFYIEDDRYSVPTLNVIALADAHDAQARAKETLRNNPHYLGVEVWEDGERLFGVGSFAHQPRQE